MAQHANARYLEGARTGARMSERPDDVLKHPRTAPTSQRTTDGYAPQEQEDRHAQRIDLGQDDRLCPAARLHGHAPAALQCGRRCSARPLCFERVDGGRGQQRAGHRPHHRLLHGACARRQRRGREAPRHEGARTCEQGRAYGARHGGHLRGRRDDCRRSLRLARHGLASGARSRAGTTRSPICASISSACPSSRSTTSSPP